MALSIAVSLAGQAAAANPAPASQASCLDFRTLAVDKIPEPSEDFTRFFGRELREWRALGSDPAPTITRRPDAELRLLAVDGFVSKPRVFEVMAWRVNGRWRVYARSRRFGGRRNRPPPLWTGWIAKRPNRADTAEIDRELGGPCLWSTPPRLPEELPLRDGRIIPFFDGPTRFLSVRAGVRKWEGLSESWRLGPSAKVSAALMFIAFRRYRCIDQINPLEPSPCPPNA